MNTQLTTEEIAMAVMALDAIWADLTKECDRLDKKLRAAKEEHEGRIMELAGELREASNSLELRIPTAPELFKTRRVMDVQGWKVGLRKSKGKLAWADEERVLRLIKSLMKQPDTLIRRTETPDRGALGKLPVDQLRKLGVELVGSGDRAVVEPPEGEAYALAAQYLQASGGGDAE